MSASILGQCKCSAVPAAASKNCNNIVVGIPPKLSDAAIYSQLEQLSLGIAPDWNSPDITTNNDIPFTLLPSVSVTVHNLSPTVPAINVLVHAYTSAYGIGLPQKYLSTQLVNISPGGSVNLSFLLPPDIIAGNPFIGFFIVIEHQNDLKQINNAGSQVISGHNTVADGRNYSVSIPICNNTSSNIQMKFSLLPNNLVATITPNSYNFSPFEQITAQLKINVPNAITGTNINFNQQEISVMTQNTVSGELIGGVTEIVYVNN